MADLPTGVPVVRVPVPALQRLIADIFVGAKSEPAEGERVARHLISANLAGHDSHGVVRVPRYVEWSREGRVVPNQHMTVATDGGAFAVVDGNWGYGQTIGNEAVDLGIEKAKGHGVAVIALRNSGHLGRIGDWSEKAAAAGQVSIHFVNVSGSLLVAPFGGVDRRLSTNPVSIGVPVKDAEPVILDFATSVVAEGKVLVAHTGGKKLPSGALIEPDGRLSTEPRTLYGDVAPGASANPNNGKGAIRAFGEHKGSGLAFMVDMLGGALTGGGTCGPPPRRFSNGMLSIYMDVAHFQSDDWFAEEVRRYVEFFKSSKPAEAGGEVLVPGEPERRTRADRTANGVPLPVPAWDGILATARSVGLTNAQIDAAVAAAKPGA